MLFNSLSFAYFFLILFFLYWKLPHRFQNLLLLSASYYFYACWNVKFLSLILLSTFVDYACGRALGQCSHPLKRKSLLLLSITTNLGLLGFFKYFNFFAENLAQFFATAFSLQLDLFTLEIILPVGISFYTFQTMSYTIDVYRQQISPCTDFLEFALFVSFFPQLVAGPIERTGALLPQIQAPRKLTYTQWVEGSWLIYWGLFKKIYVADNMGVLVNSIFNLQTKPTGAEILIGTYAFAIQIYGDFSGYTDMARGLSKLLGFELCSNFNHPYLATNPSDFWKRWHISLSSWLRDYLYIPLGGNRLGARRMYFALGMTMLLGGLWHGARWSFIIWGAYHGILLIVFRLFSKKRSVSASSRIGHFLKIFCFFHLTCLGWLFFRAEGAIHLWNLLKWSVENFQWSSIQYEWPYLTYIAILAPYQLVAYKKSDEFWILKAPFFVRVALYCTLYYMMAIYSIYGTKQFIYFQF